MPSIYPANWRDDEMVEVCEVSDTLAYTEAHIVWREVVGDNSLVHIINRWQPDGVFTISVFSYNDLWFASKHTLIREGDYWYEPALSVYYTLDAHPYMRKK